ncbi:MAG: dystroglycan-type cadherin-like domain repeat protein [Edaphobacter sp.]|nr:dystroglycan-type cadherin-like domain repeat protein [Edaphobacter sp.]
MKLISTLLLLLASVFARGQILQPTITWGPIAAITEGAALTPTQLNATANVSGTFTYTPAAGTILAPGVDIISVVFTPSDTVDFTSATAVNTILVVAPSLTPAYSLHLPAVDSLDWGELINTNFAALDDILSGATPLNGTLNAPTASAFAAAPTPCPAGQAFPGIDVHGNSVGCFTPSGGGGGGGLTSFTVGNLSPLFTATLGASPLTNPALAFTLSNAAANTVLGNFTGSSGAPTFSASPVFSAALLTNFPTFNQNTSGNAATATVATSALAAPYSGLTGTVPTWNQNTTGTASNITGVLNASSEPGFTGDVTKAAGSVATTVTKLNGTSLAGLVTGILKNTTGTGVPSIAVAADFPTLNQNTTGTAANITGVLGSGSMPTFTGDITNSGLALTVGKINGTSLAGLATGLLKNTTTTGIPSIAIAGTDYLLPTGSSAGLSQATTGAFGVVKPDGTSITIAGGVISAVSGGAGTVTTVGDLSPIFTVTSRTSTPTFVLTAAGAHAFLGNNTGSSAAPAYFQPDFTDISGHLGCTQFPNLTGDVHNTASTCATNVVGVNGILFSSYTSGLLKISNGTGNISTATAGTDYLTPTGSSAGLSVGSSSAFGVVKVDGTTITAASGVISASTGIANTTVTIGTTAIAANTCTTVATATMTGLATTSTLNFTPNADVASTTGWGGSGGLVIDAWPSATNTMSYKTCNQTAASITPGASVTFNVSAR